MIIAIAKERGHELEPYFEVIENPECKSNAKSKKIETKRMSDKAWKELGLVTMEDIALRFHWSFETVKNMRKNGDLPPTKKIKGKRLVRWLRKDIDNWYKNLPEDI